ncbi:MAG: HAMP domain-containing protein, partial [Desulfobacteraceae bacterium]|nr:HAMP domain-containing protein [Desulfobacteraceae bacterium]
PEGNLLFTFDKKEGLGSNIFTGEYANTRFAKAVSDVMLEGKATFSDFEYYPDCKNILSGFFVRDMIDDFGQRVGFVAIQINSNHLRLSIAKETGQGRSLTIYLVGEDLKLRFGSSHENRQLQTNALVDTELTRDWYENHIIKGLSEQEHSTKVLSYTNAIGQDVLGFDAHIEIVDKKFVLIAEIEKKEAYKAAIRLRNIFIVMTMLIVIIVILLAIRIARHIVIPIKELTQSVGRVASGDFDEVIQIKSDNEIGTLAQSYNSMVGNLKNTMEAMENEISQRKIHEKKANQALDATRTILENMPVGVVIVGKDRKIRLVNNAALEMMKAGSAKKIIGSICHDNICPAEEGKCPIYDLGQAVDKSEKTLLTINHEEVPILKTCIPILLEGEEVLLETFIDITQRKEFETKLEQNFQKISETNQQLKVMMVGTTEREKRMVLLKQEVNNLLSKSGQQLKYEAPQKIKDQGFEI